MSRIDAYLQLIDEPSRPALSDAHPDDDVLLGLLAHLAFADGVVRDDEVALLRRVRPSLSADAARGWAEAASRNPLDVPALLRALPNEPERWAAVRVAARMVALDGDVASAERAQLLRLARAFGFSDAVVDRAIHEVVAVVDRASPDAVTDALRQMFWDALVPDREPLGSALAAAVPAGCRLVCRVSVRTAATDEEVGGVFAEGILLPFDDGPAFVRWDTVDGYTRVPVPGAAFHLRTGGRVRSVSDPRLRDLGALLDAVYGRRGLIRG